jgi:hypothetical protein
LAAKKAPQSQSTKKKQTLTPTMQKKKRALTKGGGAPSQETKSRRQRTFNLNTYKLHSLGSYTRAIHLYGSTDNYNSQTVGFCCFKYCFTQVDLLDLG